MLMRPNPHIIRVPRTLLHCRVCDRPLDNLTRHHRNADEKDTLAALFWRMLSLAPFWLLYLPVLFLGILQRVRKRWSDNARFLNRTIVLQAQMDTADRYAVWYATALKLDHLEGLDHWADSKHSAVLDSLCTRCHETWNSKRSVKARKKKIHHAIASVDAVCDVDMIARKMYELANIYATRDIPQLANALRATLVRNLGGMCHPQLHAHSRVGTNQTVEDYVNLISFLLAYVAQSDTTDFSVHCDEDEQYTPASGQRQKLLSLGEKLTFLNEARHAYGRTALMLSGGAAMGLNHLGVVKALLEQQLLPKVVCGTSAGALVASMVAIFDDFQLASILSTDELTNPLTNMPFSFQYFDDNTSWGRRIFRLITKGFLHDVQMLQKCLRDNYGDITFEEAYNKTRRILNITVCPLRSSSDPPLLLNYLTAPNVLIWSAASASCALPLVFAPVELVAKNADGALVPYHPDGVRWIDGSITSDVPLSRIGELFNVNHFVVSQTNPHVIPRSLPILQTRLALLIKSELQFRYWQLLQMGLVPKLLRSIFPHFMQPYAGDVTIMPDIRLMDLQNLLQNPTPESIKGTVRRGEVQTFPFIDRIRQHCLIEQTLETAVECVATMAHEVVDNKPEAVSKKATAQRTPVFGRVPDWLWTDTRSMPPAGSMSSMAQRLVRSRRAQQRQLSTVTDPKSSGEHSHLAESSVQSSVSRKSEDDMVHGAVGRSVDACDSQEETLEKQTVEDLDNILREVAHEVGSASISPHSSRGNLPELSDSEESDEEVLGVC